MFSHFFILFFEILGYPLWWGGGGGGRGDFNYLFYSDRDLQTIFIQPHLYGLCIPMWYVVVTNSLISSHSTFTVCYPGFEVLGGSGLEVPISQAENEIFYYPELHS